MVRALPRAVRRRRPRTRAASGCLSSARCPRWSSGWSSAASSRRAAHAGGGGVTLSAGGGGAAAGRAARPAPADGGGDRPAEALASSASPRRPRSCPACRVRAPPSRSGCCWACGATPAARFSFLLGVPAILGRGGARRAWIWRGRARRGARPRSFAVGMAVLGRRRLPHGQVLPALSRCAPARRLRVLSPRAGRRPSWSGRCRADACARAAGASPCSGFAAASSPASSSPCRWSSAWPPSSGSSRAVDGLLGPAFTRWIGYDVPGLGLLATILGVLVVGAVATNVLGQARAAAHRVLPAEGAGLPNDLRTGQATDRRLLARERVRVQARRAGRRPVPRAPAGVPDTRVHRGPRARHGAAWWPSTCPPITSTWATCWCFLARRLRFPDITVEQGIRVFLTGGMALGGRMQRAPHRDSAGVAAAPTPQEPAYQPAATPCLTCFFGRGTMRRFRIGGYRCGERGDRDGSADADGRQWRRSCWPALARSPLAWLLAGRPSRLRMQPTRHGGPGGRPRAPAGRRGQHPAAGPRTRGTSSGFTGHDILLSGLVVCVLGLLFGLVDLPSREEAAGPPVDGRDLGSHLRDLQGLPGPAGQAAAGARAVHRRRHRLLLHC